MADGVYVHVKCILLALLSLLANPAIQLWLLGRSPSLLTAERHHRQERYFFLSCPFPPSAAMLLSSLYTNETESSFGFNRFLCNIRTLEPSLLLCLVFILHLTELIKSRSQ